LLAAGEGLVRVPPKLTVPERRAGRTRGKSDPIDALAIARAALREPDLSRPRLDEQVFRDLKLLVDHRDDLVDARRRMQQRLRCTRLTRLRRAAADAGTLLAFGARQPLARTAGSKDAGETGARARQRLSLTEPQAC
jgi:transposase